MAKIKAGRNFTKTDVICKHAATLFREKGYKAASMRTLAERMGIEAPSLYNHIGSKSEMLQTICERVADMFINQMDDIEHSELSPSKKLEKIVRFHIKAMLSHFDEMHVANNEWKHLDANSMEIFLHQRKEYETKMAQIVKEGIYAKQFRKAHPYITVLTILSALRSVEFVHKYQGQMSNRVLENNIVFQLLRGIEA